MIPITVRESWFLLTLISEFSVYILISASPTLTSFKVHSSFRNIAMAERVHLFSFNQGQFKGLSDETIAALRGLGIVVHDGILAASHLKEEERCTCISPCCGYMNLEGMPDSPAVLAHRAADAAEKISTIFMLGNKAGEDA